MRIKNDQAGLTLVELLVTIVVASIVTLSACTMLLFGLRINNQSTKNSMGQNTVQVLMEALEDVAAEAEDLAIVNNPDSWKVIDIANGGEKVLFWFDSEKQAVFTGDSLVQIPFLQGVYSSFATLDENGLITFSVETASGSYTTSIYRRLACTPQDDVAVKNLVTAYQGIDTSTATQLELFLHNLMMEYGSLGEIKENNSDSYQYYSEWYLRNKGGYTDNPSWNKNTPWCACYISWAVNRTSANKMPEFAHVDKMASYFETNNLFSTSGKVGDVVFFDWDADDVPQHVGIVLSISEDSDYFYTIEGNSAGRVAIRKYAAGDPRIIGYGVLNWNS